MVRDEKAVPLYPLASNLDSGSDDPGRRGKESARPGRSAEKCLREHMNRTEDGEQPYQPRDAQGRAEAEVRSAGLSDRG